MRWGRSPVAIVLAALIVGSISGCTGDGDTDRSAVATAVTLSGTVERAPRTAVPHLAWGPSVVDAAQAKVRAAALPLDVAAGHVIVASWDSTDAAAASALVSSHHLAGVILMGGAIEDRDQVLRLTRAVTEAAALDGRSWPAIVSTDQEGGPVARLEGLVPDMPAFMAAGSTADTESVTAAYAAQARDMADLGFTVDWAPDADVTIGAADTTIGVRSAGSDPDRVAEAVVAAMSGYIAGGLAPSVKHFPGHGSVTTDSHAGLPAQTASLESLAERDFVPFARAIDAGAPMVMMGHVAVTAWGSEPATTSPAAYEYLRDELGFTGVTVTDAMNMAAVADRFEPGAGTVAALAAGADLVLMPPDAAAAHQAIIDAVTAGTLPRARLDEAVARVDLLMQWQADVAAATAGTAAPEPDYARQAAAAWATVSTPSCGARLVGESVTIRGGWPAERQVLADALASHGVGAGGGTSVLLLGSATGSGSADVVVAMDAPWGLPASTATTYVGLYGRSPDALRGLADVLVGATVPGGSWAVPGMPPSCQ